MESEKRGIEDLVEEEKKKCEEQGHPESVSWDLGAEMPGVRYYYTCNRPYLPTLFAVEQYRGQ